MGMLLLSTAASVTGTVAWFSMNNSVSATGMELKVKADDGILISTSAKSVWADSAESAIPAATLLPTSAAAIASPAFVSANSTNADEAQGNQALAKYNDLSLSWSVSATTEGVGYVEASSPANSTFDAADHAYVLLTKYYIRSSGATITQQDEETLLYVSDVAATATGTLNKVDNSLRVLVVVGSDAFIYAPLKDVASGTTTMSYTWKATTAVAAKAPDVYDVACPSVTTISHLPASALEVKIYCYFEGEDVNCKSTNISGIEMNDLEVTVNFASVTKHA